MSAYVQITLDTTAPGGVAASINSGAGTTDDPEVSLGITTTDPDTTGYTMKIWGSVDNAADADIQTTEGASAWIAYNATKLVTLSTGDGSKTLNVKVRDDVFNASGGASDAITLDTTSAVVTVTDGPDVSRVSEQATKDTMIFKWTSDADFEEYKIKAVPSTSSDHTAGTQIPTTAGSSFVSGVAGGYPDATEITTTIKGTDLKTASAGDALKTIKVFVKDGAGNWSN
jgi:hypothetical protein